MSSNLIRRQVTYVSRGLTFYVRHCLSRMERRKVMVARKGHIGGEAGCGGEREGERGEGGGEGCGGDEMRADIHRSFHLLPLSLLSTLITPLWTHPISLSRLLSGELCLSFLPSAFFSLFLSLSLCQISILCLHPQAPTNS